MKITKTNLRKMIKEELSAVMEGVVVDFDARRKERDSRKIPVRRWAQPVLDEILAIGVRGKNLLNRLAAVAAAEEVPGAEQTKWQEDTEGHTVLQDLGHDEQLDWVLFNVINAWRERKGEE
jgi:hypothetical protein